MTARLAVPYDPADPEATARDADRALEGTGARVIYRRENASVWICGKNEPETSAQLLDVGQRLVVESGGAWRIEDVPAGPTPYLEALCEARREAVANWRQAVDALANHIDDKAEGDVHNLVAACDKAREVFVAAHSRLGAEEFQVRLIPILGRRGDQLPKAATP